MTHQTELDVVEASTADQNLIHRTFDAEITSGAGRTIDVRIVPYGERATVADGFGGVARGHPYQEEWMPGVFDHQLNAANRVLANIEHERGVLGIVGHGLTLRSQSDGFHGSFRALNTQAGDTALELVQEGVLAGVSVEARPRKSVRTVAGVVQRVKADLFAIAFCRTPAFAGAQVLAVREQDITFDEEHLPVEMDPELVERCRRLGIKLPQRYQGHPDATDTPADAGTSENGTAQ